MLQNIREHIQGWFAGIIIAIIALSFILFGIESYLKAENPNYATVAVVNGEKITAHQLQERYHRLLDQLPNANVLSDGQRAKIQQQALTQLVNEAALLQIAKKMGLQISELQLKSAIISMPTFQENGRFSVLRFNQVLMANHLSARQFEEQIEQALLLNELQNIIQSTAFALPTEVQQSYVLLEQTRDLGYFEISAQQLSSTFTPSDEQIKAYYQHHQGEFLQPEELRIQYVELSPEQLANEIKVNTAELQQYYQQHLNNFPKTKDFTELKPELIKRYRQEKIEQILAESSEELANLSFTHPDSLEPIAKALHLDIQTTPFFGKAGMPKGLLSDPKIIEAAFSETVLEQGENSSPIETKAGNLVVLRVLQHQTARAKPLKDMLTGIVKRLAIQHSQRQAAQLGKQIAKALNEGVKPEQLARQYHLNWILRSGVSYVDPHLPRAILNAAFDAPINAAKVVSKAVVVPLASGDYAVMQVLGHQWGSFARLSEQEQQQRLAVMARTQAKIEYQLYEQGLLKQADIELKPLKSLHE